MEQSLWLQCERQHLVKFHVIKIWSPHHGLVTRLGNNMGLFQEI